MSSSDEDAREGEKRRYNREQIEILERVFTHCTNPDERRRIELSRRLGLKPHQIKYWFQNKRTSIKIHNDKLASIRLSDENKSLRCAITEVQTAVKNCMCSRCRGPLRTQKEEELLLLLNDQCVKSEINQRMEIITNQLGRSFAEMNLMQVHPLGTDRVVSNNSSMNIALPPPPQQQQQQRQQQEQQLLPVYAPISSTDKALLIDQATNAMQELVELARSTDQYWIKPMYEDKEILDLLNYRKTFKKFDHHLRNLDNRVEASRASGLVCMNPLYLVDIFMDPAKWTDLFQTVVTKAKIIDVISVGMGGDNHSGSLLLMHSEIGNLCPLIPSREYYFVRYCQKVNNGSWFITDVSVDFPAYVAKNRRLPSGCMIEEMPNGYSMVTWVEHLEVEEINGINLGVFQSFIHSGKAFGAQRWLATLQRMTQRFHCMWTLGPQNMDTGGVILTQESKRSFMSLSHRMVRSFCSSLCPSNDWIIIMDSNETKIRALPHQIVDNFGSDGIILNPITSIWLPFSTERIFNFFMDVSKRDLWDILSVGNMMQPITNLFTGFNIGNCISLLRAATSDENQMLLMQEMCTDSSVSMLAFASVDNSIMQSVLSGGETLNLPLISSGVAILPNCNPSVSMRPSSSSNPAIAGSFVTLSFQIPLNNQSTNVLNLDTLNGLNKMMSDAVKNVKTALNSP